MSYSEPPFAEYEERYLLVEILKRSSLPTQALFAIVRDAQIEPQWTEIALPYGRSVSSCQQAFNVLGTRSVQDPQNAYPLYRRSLANPDLERANAAGRELQPRPPLFTGGFNPPSGPAGYRFSTLEPPPRKKRGRPSKEEFERRAAEARARGEEYPKRRAKAQKRSADDINKDSPSKVESVNSPTDFRAGDPTSLLSPRESGATSASQSAVPFLMHSPQSNQAPGSVTSMSEGSSGGRAPQVSGPPIHHAQQQEATGSMNSLLHPPTFPNQETGYGFSLPGTMPRDIQRPPAHSAGGPSVPHSASGGPARDPYGYYPGAPFPGYHHDEQSHPGS